MADLLCYRLVVGILVDFRKTALRAFRSFPLVSPVRPAWLALARPVPGQCPPWGKLPLLAWVLGLPRL